MNRKLRFGMIGGGRGAFIGGIHRVAACMDGHAELVAGAFSSDPIRSADSAADLGVKRAYGSFLEMAQQEAAVEAAQRLDFVIIVTPNDQHYPAAKVFLEHGFNVVCDKPVTLTLAEAEDLQRIVKRTGKVFVLTHNYVGNVMVKKARQMVLTGALGTIRKVVVEYQQGWLWRDLERSGQKQAAWRTDPKRNGPAGCIGDIGVHAEHLARYITGLELHSVSADLTTFVPGRRLEDDASILLRYRGGAKGVLHCSQIAIGEENNLAIRIFGSAAALEWKQETPDELVLKRPEEVRQVWRRGHAYLGAEVARFARLPAGHPEGYLEAFANVYREALTSIRCEVSGKRQPIDPDYPTIRDGVLGMAFIEAAVSSSRRDGQWVPLQEPALERGAA